MSNTHPSEAWEDELAEAPILKSLQERSAFEVPEGYFDRMAEEVQSRVEEQSLQEENPVLHTLPKQQVFQTPAQYFETFPERMKAVLEASEQEVSNATDQAKVKVFRLMRPRYLLAIAAAVSLLFLIRIGISPQPQALDLEDIPVEELMAAVEWDNIPIETLADLLNEENELVETEDPVLFEEDMSDLLEELDDTDLENMLDDLSLDI